MSTLYKLRVFARLRLELWEVGVARSHTTTAKARKLWGSLNFDKTVRSPITLETGSKAVGAHDDIGYLKRSIALPTSWCSSAGS
ncbi:hypothetical protein QUB08_08430 [Microcoleus sp. BR0-C5]|uniref:hypothetical protein n=1 Tax=Microcoleus sp. BR0-C5 TaxID=2818713 RepID=UPI002FD06FB8